MNDESYNTEKKNVLRIYAAFGATLILSIIPSVFAAILSAFLGMGVLIVSYILRAQQQHGSLLENHMTFIIRTIWIGSVFALISTTLGSLYLFLNLDNAPLEPCLSNFLSIAQNIRSFAGLKTAFGACYEPYWFLNARTFITGGAIIAVPVLVYFAVRYTRGLARASKGYRVAKPLSWL